MVCGGHSQFVTLSFGFVLSNLDQQHLEAHQGPTLTMFEICQFMMTPELFKYFLKKETI